MGWKDAPIIGDAPKWASAPLVSNKAGNSKAGIWDQLKRAAGLSARTLTEWATDFPTTIADIPVQAANALGANIPTFSGSREVFLDRAYPKPESNAERLINLASRGGLGGGSIALAAGQAPGRLAQVMAQRPLLQTVSGATGAGSSEVARQKGAGPVGQTIAGLVGAATPALISPRAPLPEDGQALAERLTAQSQAAAGANATATATPGLAAAETTVNTTPEIQARGGGYTFGAVGPDESAGLTPSQQRIMASGQDLGMRMTPGQATGSRALQQMEAKLESQPMTSGPFNTIKANNARVLNRQAAAAIGEVSNTVDDAVLANARDRISGVYAAVADDVPRQIDPDRVVNFLSGLENDTRGLVKGLADHPLVDDVISAASNGHATGRQLQNIASKLGKAANSQMTTASGDRELGMALFHVKDFVDDFIAQGLSPEMAAAFETARAQYRNLMLLTQRVGVVNPSTGNVSGRSLANLLQSKDKNGFLYGRNQTGMYNAARFAQAFQPIVGDSGTATRMPLQGLTDMLMRIPLNIATRTYTSSPAVNLAVGAQAGARAITGYARGVTAPLGAPDVPMGGVYGATQSQREAEAKRRAMAEALMRSQ